MIDLFRRIDRAWARGEEWLIVVVLILMVLVAAFQAGVRNLTRFDIGWANHMLMNMAWADSFLRKGTLWISFLGASIATFRHKHIAIDVLLRVAPVRSKYWMLALGGVLTGLITLGVTYSFWSAAKLNLTERPVEYEILGDNGPMHVCDATQEQLKNLVGVQKPTVFCAARSVLAVLHIPAETPGAAFQLIVPLAFLAISIRLFAYGIAYFGVATGDDAGIEREEAEERARILAQEQSLHIDGPPSDNGGQS